MIGSQHCDIGFGIDNDHTEPGGKIESIVSGIDIPDTIGQIAIRRIEVTEVKAVGIELKDALVEEIKRRELED